MRPPQAPKVHYFEKVVGNAFAIAMVSYVIAISLGKIFALKHGYKVDSNQVRRLWPLSGSLVFITFTFTLSLLCVLCLCFCYVFPGEGWRKRAL